MLFSLPAARKGRAETLMIEARVLDQTTADDYIKAMEKIEQRLTLPITILNLTPSTSEMLDLVDKLFSANPNSSQFHIITRLRFGMLRLEKQKKSSRNEKLQINT
jgi:hypothetical protein